MLEYQLVANSGDVIAGDFNYGLLKVSSNKLLDHMIGCTQIINEPNRSCLYKDCFVRGVSYQVHCLTYILC